MASEMTVTKILNRKQWPAEGEAKQIYFDVILEGVEGKVSVGQKPGIPDLKPGDSVFGVLEDTEYGKKLKKERQGGFGGRPDSPEQRRSIERQCAFKGVVELIIHDKAELKDLRKLVNAAHEAIEGDS